MTMLSLESLVVLESLLNLEGAAREAVRTLCTTAVMEASSRQRFAEASMRHANEREAMTRRICTLEGQVRKLKRGKP